MELGLEGALTRECPSCHENSPLSAAVCPSCGFCLVPAEDVSMDFTAADFSEEGENYVPLHRSPNLLALREAVEELRAGSIDEDDFHEIVTEVQESVKPLLQRFEQQAKIAGDKMPPDLKWVFTLGLETYRDYYDALELTLQEPEKGLRAVQIAMQKLDDMEKRL